MTSNGAAVLSRQAGSALGAARTESGKSRTEVLVRFFERLLVVAAFGLLCLQWLARDDGYISAERGIGYLLGIGGAASMLLLLTYSARKRFGFMRRWGAVRHWFRVHMLLGLIGPAMIIAHSNFKLGSTNAAVALICMLLVSGSGLIGRYIYTRIHLGLYGARATLRRMMDEIGGQRDVLASSLKRMPELMDRLSALEAAAAREPAGFIAAALRVPLFAFRTRWCAIQSRRAIAELASRARKKDRSNSTLLRRHQRALRAQIAIYLATVRKTAQLGFYERMFSLWHVLHIPLFFMLVLATIVHVFAVHAF